MLASFVASAILAYTEAFRKGTEIGRQHHHVRCDTNCDATDAVTRARSIRVRERAVEHGRGTRRIERVERALTNEMCREPRHAIGDV